MPTERPLRRSLLQRLFRGGLGRPLINMWVEVRSCSEGQRITYSRLKLGRYTVLQWERIDNDLDALER